MFGKSYKLFKLAGFEVKIDMSWLILAFIVTWTLAEGLFPVYHEGLSPPVYWWMGAFGALGLFASIVFHELSHSLVARRGGMPMKGITLFIFGGVAEMDDEPPDARTELFMALAGPASSLLLAGIFFGAAFALRFMEAPLPVRGVISYLGLINVILAAFNMVPAFPLDGGRVLRAILWKWKNNLKWATHIAANMGTGFGTVLMILGVFQVFAGNVIGGIWWFIIGMFLRGISQSSYRQVILKKTLEGEKVERFMKRDPVVVPPSLSISDFVENYVYTHHFKFFPVVEDGKHVGCVTVKNIKEIPREQWQNRTVGEVSEECSTENTVSPDTDAMKALTLMNRQGSSRLMVVEDGNLEGVITLKDLMGFFSTKLDLEGEE